MSTIEYSTINQSPTVDFLAAEALTNPQGVALALSDEGVKRPEAGADVVGIALVSNPEAVAAGERVDVQVKDIGRWYAASEFAAGDLLATDAAGKAVKANSGNMIIARALDAASAAGDLVRVQIINAGSAASA